MESATRLDAGHATAGQRARRIARTAAEGAGRDLAQPWVTALVDAGFDPQRKAAFLAEGLLYYLDESGAISLFDASRSVATIGSWLGVDAMNPEVLISPFMATYLKKLTEFGSPWRFGMIQATRAE
jgi:O-methyltransferase involved in polyketide biosynthesis